MNNKSAIAPAPSFTVVASPTYRGHASATKMTNASGHVMMEIPIATDHDTRAALPRLMGTEPMVAPVRPFTAK